MLILTGSNLGNIHSKSCPLPFKSCEHVIKLVFTVIMTSGAIKSLWLEQDGDVPFLQKICKIIYPLLLKNDECSSGLFLLVQLKLNRLLSYFVHAPLLIILNI